MSQLSTNPRSELHSLLPLGSGSNDVESLVSYYCRLAVSHSVSTAGLSRIVAERVGHDVVPGYDWHQRQLGGIRESAIACSGALSAMTGVGGLDKLTFLPWRNVIAQNGLSISSGQFCPMCFEEDLAQARTPYFRLAWELADVQVCIHHGCKLVDKCHSCHRGNIRHAASYVVPGWCTSCGEFLGRNARDEVITDPLVLWVAEQVSELVALQSSISHEPVRDDIIGALTHLIAELDNGQSSLFAQRVGVAKSTIHYWLKSGGTPTLKASLKIARQAGCSLVQLLTGNLTDWTTDSGSPTSISAGFPTSQTQS